MIVLGIDPGTANTGYGVVERRCGRLFALDGGVIATRPEAPMQIRLAHIHRRVCELMDEHLVTVVSMEDIYFGRNAARRFRITRRRTRSCRSGKRSPASSPTARPWRWAPASSR